MDIRGSLVTIHLTDDWSICGRVTAVSRCKSSDSDKGEQLGVSIYIGGMSFHMLCDTPVDQDIVYAMVGATMTHSYETIETIDLRDYYQHY